MIVFPLLVLQSKSPRYMNSSRLADEAECSWPHDMPRDEHDHGTVECGLVTVPEDAASRLVVRRPGKGPPSRCRLATGLPAPASRTGLDRLGHGFDPELAEFRLRIGTRHGVFQRSDDVLGADVGRGRSA